VISVGSANARSPGRTSTVRALIRALRDRGHVVGVALRGYRRTRPGRDVRLSSALEDLGDEGALLASAGALVAAGPDRVRAARLLADAGATVIVLDDGLRHRHLHRDLDLCVVDARYPGARGRFPMGERRGSAIVPPGVDLVLVHHGDARFSFPGEPVVRAPTAWSPRAPVGPVAAFCGIGRAADFLASLDVPVARFRAFPDHATPDPDALRAWAGGLPLACTAKDAARLPGVELHARDVDVTLPRRLLDRLPVR
jgi:tetraacyldisaccharide 4'-kinase